VTKKSWVHLACLPNGQRFRCSIPQKAYPSTTQISLVTYEASLALQLIWNGRGRDVGVGTQRAMRIRVPRPGDQKDTGSTVVSGSRRVG
jgi:hypothetical protein